MKILIAEDDVQLSIILFAVLRKTGFAAENIDIFNSSKEAVRHIKEMPTLDVLFTDWDLGDGLGSEVIKEARRKNPNVKVIVVSGRDIKDPEIWESAPDFFIQKPYEPRGLMEAVKPFLNRAA